MLVTSVHGQTQKPASGRRGDPAAAVSQSVDPDSPATRSHVGAGAQANGASPETIVPRLIKFSGVLHDATAKPLSGSVDVTFSLYNTEAGGDALWFETQTVQADELGRYTALLGAMHAGGLPVALFTSGEVRWLGIQVGQEREQQPRVLLVSVPYALKAGDAETLGGKPASAYMLSDSQNGTSSTLAALASRTAPASTDTKNQMTFKTNPSPLTGTCSSVTIGGTAVMDAIAYYDEACYLDSANIFQSSGNIGIGIATPGAPLHIFGLNATDSDARYSLIAGDSTSAGAGTGGGIDFSGYYNGTTSKAGFANIRGVKENATQGDYASALIFDTRANGGNQTERMRISSAGNLGIGNSSPAYKLDIIDTSSDRARLKLSRGETTNINGSADLMLGNRNLWQVGTDWEQNGANDLFVYQTGPSPYMFISSTGNLGIGTTAPGAMLEVNGTAKFDNTVTFAAGQAFTGTGSGLTSLNPANLSAGTAGISITGNAATATTATNASTLNGVSNYARLDIANSFGGNQSVAGNLFVGTGTSSNIPLEVQAGGQDALTMDSSGNIAVGLGSGTRVTTASANTDLAGQISISAASSGSHTFTNSGFITNPPVCVASPLNNSLGTVTWYVTITKTQLTVTLSGPATVTFNYICVGNPN